MSRQPKDSLAWGVGYGVCVRGGKGLVLVHLYSPGRHLSMPLTDVQVAPLCDKNNPSRHFQKCIRFLNGVRVFMRKLKMLRFALGARC